MIANGVSYLIANNEIHQIQAIGTNSIEFVSPTHLTPGTVGTVHVMLSASRGTSRKVRFPIGIDGGRTAHVTEDGLTTEPEHEQVITIRMPVALHAALRSAAFARETSLNKLCIAKLVCDAARDVIPVPVPPQPEPAATA